MSDLTFLDLEPDFPIYVLKYQNIKSSKAKENQDENLKLYIAIFMKHEVY